MAFSGIQEGHVTLRHLDSPALGCGGKTVLLSILLNLLSLTYFAISKDCTLKDSILYNNRLKISKTINNNINHTTIIYS